MSEEEYKSPIKYKAGDIFKSPKGGKWNPTGAPVVIMLVSCDWNSELEMYIWTVIQFPEFKDDSYMGARVRRFSEEELGEFEWTANLRALLDNSCENRDYVKGSDYDGKCAKATEIFKRIQSRGEDLFAESGEPINGLCPLNQQDHEILMRAMPEWDGGPLDVSGDWGKSAVVCLHDHITLEKLKQERAEL